MAKSHDEIWDEWSDLVNMTKKELETFLDTEESEKVGQDSGDGESKGHKSGKRIVEILNKKKGDLTDDDFDHMGRVVAYVKRHRAQGGPDEDMEHSDWRYSLMNWGHDPAK